MENMVDLRLDACSSSLRRYGFSAVFLFGGSHVARYSLLVGLLAQTANAQFPISLKEAEPSKLRSAPMIVGASNCGNGTMIVSLSGGEAGAEYVVWDALPGPHYGTELGGGPVAPNAQGYTQIEVLDPRSWGSTHLAAVIRTPASTSEYSPLFALRVVAQVAAPAISPSPVWECGLATGIMGHQPGDEVTLYSGTRRRFLIPSAFAQHDFTPAGVRPFQSQETLYAGYRTCEAARFGWTAPHPQVSPLSAPVVVQSFIGQLPAPGIVPNSVLPGARQFQLEGTEHGALISIDLVRGGATSSWTEVCPWDPCGVSVGGPGDLQPGDELRVTQRLCSGSDSSVAVLTARDCKDVPPPTLAAPPRAGDTSIALAAYSPGATIVVYVSKSSTHPQHSLWPIGRAAATSQINLFRPIERDDRWIVVAQQTPPETGGGYPVAD